MTRLVVTEQPPLPETIRIVEAAVGRALLWQPRRWVEDVPAPPEANPAEVRDEAAWGWTS